jgi:hypothetical protein
MIQSSAASDDYNADESDVGEDEENVEENIEEEIEDTENRDVFIS